MLRPIALIWVILCLFAGQGFAEDQTSSQVPLIPLPVNLPSNLFSGDVTPAFVQQMAMADKVPEDLVQIGPQGYFSDYVFVIDKTVRSLGVWKFLDHQWQRIAFHPTDIGKNAGDKHLLGDARTPEGIYFFVARYEGQNLDYAKYGSRAFATDYPNFYDRREGKTGSGIWLHAVPDSVPLTRGSRGCVVVRDQIIQKVTDYISLEKTPIIIKNRENYLTTAQWQKRQEEFKSWLEDWRKAWQNLDSESYMSYYSKDQFYSLGKNWLGWKKYKESLNKKYEFVRIDFSEPLILTHRDEAVIRFLQDYKSNLFSDFGEKTLYLKNENGNWKIISEQWKKVPPTWRSALHQAAKQATQVGAIQNN